MARCILLISCQTDLNHCDVFVDQIGVFLKHVYRTLKFVNSLCKTSLSFLILSFGSCSKHHNRCNIHLNSESITGQPALKLVVMASLLGSSRTVVFLLKEQSVCKYYLQTMFMQTVCILRMGVTPIIT